MRGNRDLRLASVVAIACGLVAGLCPWDGVRLAFALPLAFFLPGYAIVAASFGPRMPQPLQTIMVSFGCSLAVLALGALILNYVPGGIQTASWAILLALLSLAACRVAAIRRPAVARVTAIPRPPRPRAFNAIVGLTAVALATGSIVLANTPLPASKAAGYTALWILPSGAEGHAARLGVSSSEHGTRHYILTFQVPGRGQATVSEFALRPGDERVFEVPVPASNSRKVRVTAILYRPSRPTIAYRKVRTWLPPWGR